MIKSAKQKYCMNCAMTIHFLWVSPLGLVPSTVTLESSLVSPTSMLGPLRSRNVTQSRAEVPARGHLLNFVEPVWSTSKPCHCKNLLQKLAALGCYPALNWNFHPWYYDGNTGTQNFDILDCTSLKCAGVWHLYVSMATLLNNVRSEKGRSAKASLIISICHVMSLGF